jgi:hypothetical protein
MGKAPHSTRISLGTLEDLVHRFEVLIWNLEIDSHVKDWKLLLEWNTITIARSIARYPSSLLFRQIHHSRQVRPARIGVQRFEESCSLRKTDLRLSPQNSHSGFWDRFNVFFRNPLWHQS